MDIIETSDSPGNAFLWYIGTSALAMVLAFVNLATDFHDAAQQHMKQNAKGKFPKEQTVPADTAKAKEQIVVPLGKNKKDPMMEIYKRREREATIRMQLQTGTELTVQRVTLARSKIGRH